MLLVRQFNSVKVHLNALDWKSNPTADQRHIVANCASLMKSVRALELIPALRDSARAVLAALPVASDDQTIFTSSVYIPLKQRLDTLNLNAQQLLRTLQPLILKEDESTLYLELPSVPTLAGFAKFAENLTKNLDQIFTINFSNRFSLGLKGVEKGSSWLVISLLVDQITANIDQVAKFIKFLSTCVDYYEKIEALERLVNRIKGYRKTGPEQKTAEQKQRDLISPLQEEERKTLIESILAITPASNDHPLSPEDEIRISTAAFQIGKIFVEETQIEVSGLIEERVGKDVLTTVEHLKVVKRRSVELLPNSDLSETE